MSIDQLRVGGLKPVDSHQLGEPMGTIAISLFDTHRQCMVRMSCFHVHDGSALGFQFSKTPAARAASFKPDALS